MIVILDFDFKFGLATNGSERHPLGESVSEQKAVNTKDPGNPVRKRVVRLALSTLLLTLSLSSTSAAVIESSTDKDS